MLPGPMDLSSVPLRIFALLNYVRHVVLLGWGQQESGQLAVRVGANHGFRAFSHPGLGLAHAFGLPASAQT